jgi:hypothetical protein
MARIFLSLALMFSLGGLAQRNSTGPVESCFRAEAEEQNIAVSTAWALTYYVVGFRVIPPIVEILWAKFKPIEGETISRGRAGVVAGLELAQKAPSGIIGAGQVLAFISFLVTPYFYREWEHAHAECRHDTDFQMAPNATVPRECYLADSDNRIFSFISLYSFGLYLGVNIALPMLLSAIAAWAKGEYRVAGKVPMATEPMLQVALAVPDAPLQPKVAWCAAISEGFKKSGFDSGPYALVDAQQLTAIAALLVPLLGLVEKFRSRASCNFQMALELARNETETEP